MSILRRIWTHLRVLTQARRHRTDLPGWLARRPQLFAAYATYEAVLLSMGRLDPELKVLAAAKAAAIVNCEFCLDIGSALAEREGVPEAKLRALPRYLDSDELTDLEKQVIAFAEAMSSTPAVVPDDLRDRRLAVLSRTQLAELAAEVAWENHRGRLHQGLGVRPAGFSDGAFCMLPEGPGAGR